MVETVQTIAEAKLSISASLPTVIGAGTGGFPGLSYDEIGEVIDIPEYGKEYTVVTHNPIRTRMTQKFKGAYNNGSMTLAMARSDADEGQVIALTALDDDADYSFEIEFQDGSFDYFTAKVTKFSTAGGDVNSIVNRMMNLEITSEIVSVPAA